MSITFAVDDVAPAAALAETIPLARLIGEHAALGLPADLPVLPIRRAPPLLAAVQRAFDEHRPLVLSPDAIWLTIATGVATHVRLHAEALRPRLVRHTAGKRVLEVLVPGIPTDAAGWTALLADFRAALAGEIGDGRARLFACDFSTSGEAERVAGEIVLMDVYAPFYEYVGGIICGIPELTITGTVADWRAIRTRLAVIDELALGFWTASLAPILDRLIDAVDGRPHLEFFRSIYKPRAAYGADLVTGWIGRLYPYVRGDSGDFDRRNPLLAFALDQPLPGSGGPGFYEGPGLKLEDAPSGPSKAVVHFVDRRAGTSATVEIEGGLLAVEQDPRGRLVPRAGWSVRPPQTGRHAVIERIRREHRVIAEGDGALGLGSIEEAILFEGRAPTWRILPAADRTLIQLGDTWWEPGQLTRVVDLPDGSFLATSAAGVARLRADRLGPAQTTPLVGLDEITGLWLPEQPSPPFRCTDERIEDIPIVGESLVAVVQAALIETGRVPAPTGRTLANADERLRDTLYHAARLLERLRHPPHRLRLIEGRDELISAIADVTVMVGDQPWRLVPSAERVNHQLGGAWSELVVELPDRTGLAYAWLGARRCYVQVRTDLFVEEVSGTGRRALRVLRSSQPLADIPVIGRSLVEILTHALDHGGLPASLGSFEEVRAREVAESYR